MQRVGEQCDVRLRRGERLPRPGTSTRCSTGSERFRRADRGRAPNGTARCRHCHRATVYEIAPPGGRMVDDKEKDMPPEEEPEPPPPQRPPKSGDILKKSANDENVDVETSTKKRGE